MERFWNKVKKTDGCWEWTASKDGFGYGYILYQGSPARAHRMSWIIHYGHIPKGICVLHKCDNPSCVRPTHLFLGTIAENNKDRSNKKRSADFKKDKNPNAFLNKKSIKDIRKKYKSKKFLQKELAKIYGVKQTAISKIVTHRTWK